MVLIASETSAFENVFHVIMSVAMNMVPNFWSEMVGVVTGFILPEVLIEIVLAVIAALTGAGVALLAGRFVAFIGKLRGMARKAASLSVLADILDAFRKAIAALAKIGKGLHDELEAATRAGADGVARIRHRVNQYKLEIDPNTLGMNGGKIRVDRKANPERLTHSGGRGTASNRPYDPDNAGGPIRRSDWRTAQIDESGISDVRTHVGRFDDDPANAAMIDRLDRISRGELAPTDYDLRYYTHEMRELERYRNLGIPDGVDPGYDVWNNAHTATLEDFGLSDLDANGNSILYHPSTWSL